MMNVKRARPRLPYYLIPIIVGMAGLLFARQLDNQVMFITVFLLSVASGVFAGGNLLAKLRSQGYERYVLVVGIVLLVLGAMAVAVDLSGKIGEAARGAGEAARGAGEAARGAGIPDSVGALSHWLGMFSVLVGVCAVLFIVVRREEAVEELVEQFRHLAEHMSEGFVFSTADGRIILVNKAFLKLTGLSENDVLGKDSRDLASRLQLEPMLSHLDLRAKGLASEYRLTWRVGEREREFLVSGTPVFERRGVLAGTLATFRDVTEQFDLSRRLEQYTHGLEKLVQERTVQLHQSEDSLRSLLVHMNEGFLTVDASHRIRFANERFCRVILRSPDEVVGRDVFDFVETMSRGKLLQLFEFARTSGSSGFGDRSSQQPNGIDSSTSNAETFGMGSPQSGGSPKSGEMPNEIALTRPGGSSVPVVVAIAPIRPRRDDAGSLSDGGGERGHDGTPCYSLVMTDVSELKRTQQQLEVRAKELEVVNEELRTLDRAKDSFLTNVSHELRTPLSTVRGYAEMLDSGNLGELRGGQVGALRVMMRNIERLNTLIEEMIDFSLMEIRGVKLAKTLFGVEKLVRECMASARPQAADKDVAIEIGAVGGDAGAVAAAVGPSPSSDVPPGGGTYPGAGARSDLPPVWGDRKRIGQVLTNLVSNAIKFSYQGGEVRVSFRKRDDGALALAVTDAGIGIEKAFQRRVFDKFFQVDSSLSRRYEGAGIGLSIAKSVAEAHGGTIELESEPGRGSTFTLVLPDAFFEDPAKPWDSTAHGPQPAFEGMVVFVLTDEDEFAEALGRVLSTWGAETRHFRKGYEGVRLAKETSPDVIFVDEALSDVGGSGILAELRHTPDTADIPLVLLAGEAARGAGGSAPSYAAPSREPGVGILTKPFHPADLVAVVRRALSEDPVGGDAGDVGGDAGAEPRRPAEARRKPAVEKARPLALVVDSDSEMLEWIETAFAHRAMSCYCSPDPEQALGRLRDWAPDVVFVNLDGPNGHGARLIAELRQGAADGASGADGASVADGASATRCVPVYGMTGLPPDRYSELPLTGILRKPFSIDEIANIVRRIPTRSP